MITAPILFQIKHHRLHGNSPLSRRVFATIRQSDLKFLQSIMGKAQTLELLQSLFEQLTAEQRRGDLMFYSPGLKKIVISWFVKKDFDQSHFLPSLQKGIEKTNPWRGASNVELRLKLLSSWVGTSQWPITLIGELIKTEAA